MFKDELIPTARTINHSGGRFNLSSSDLLAIVGTLVVGAQVGELLSFGWVGFVLCTLTTVLLAAIRLRFRRRIIRDFLMFWIVPRRINAL